MAHENPALSASTSGFTVGLVISRRRFLVSTALAAASPVLALPASAPVLRLGLVTDPQYADAEPLGTRFYRESIGKLTEAVTHFNALDLAFSVNLGDLIDRDWSSFDAILKPLRASRARFYHVLGNHDFDLPDAFKPRVPGRLGLRRRYSSFARGSFRWVFLDTNDVSSYAHPATAPEHTAARAELARLAATGAINAQAWNGAIGDRQLQWFEQSCQRARQAGQKVVVFAHHPVFPPDAHNAWNAEVVLEMIRRHGNVVAWLNGHQHGGALASRDEVPFVTLKGMVETRDTNAFAVAEFHRDRLVLTGHGREPSRELVFRRA